METREAIEKYYDANFDKLVLRIKGRVGVDYAEDVVQEGFYRALRYSSGYKDNPAGPGKWVWRIISNCARDVWKEKQGIPSMQQYEEDEDVPPDPPEYEAKCEEVLKLAAALVKRKKGLAKEVCELSLHKQYHPREIVRITNTPINTVNWHLKELRREVSKAAKAAKINLE